LLLYNRETCKWQKRLFSSIRNTSNFSNNFRKWDPSWRNDSYAVPSRQTFLKTPFVFIRANLYIMWQQKQADFGCDVREHKYSYKNSVVHKLLFTLYFKLPLNAARWIFFPTTFGWIK
jgi:hypothetical protein